MSTKTALSSDDELLSAAANLDKESFSRFVNQILALQARRRSYILSEIEAQLLTKINLGITSSSWQRYETLKAKRRAVTLDPSEHDELIEIGNQIELANAKRIAALAELAVVRKASINDVMLQLGIIAPDVEQL